MSASALLAAALQLCSFPATLARSLAHVITIINIFYEGIKLPMGSFCCCHRHAEMQM